MKKKTIKIIIPLNNQTVKGNGTRKEVTTQSSQFKHILFIKGVWKLKLIYYYYYDQFEGAIKKVIKEFTIVFFFVVIVNCRAWHTFNGSRSGRYLQHLSLQGNPMEPQEIDTKYPFWTVY